MNRLETITVQVDPEQAVALFVHHLQIAVACLADTPLNKWDAMTKVHGLEGVSDTMKVFAANGVMAAFHTFEFDEENSDYVDTPDLDIVEINLNDPNAMQKLHETIEHFTGDKSVPRE